jgi:hypothetical protein
MGAEMRPGGEGAEGTWRGLKAEVVLVEVWDWVVPVRPTLVAGMHALILGWPLLERMLKLPLLDWVLGWPLLEGLLEWPLLEGMLQRPLLE